MSPNLQAELGSALRNVVDEMGATAAQLVTILDEEREALTRADAGALNRAGEAKQMLMRKLEGLDAERLHLSGSGSDAASQVDPTWRELLTVLAECRDKNQRNGNLVNQRLGQVRRALSVLTAGKDENTHGVYSARGAYQGAARSLTLAQA